MTLCKITVLKRTFHRDLVDKYLEADRKPQGPCERFEEGQKFLINPFKVPEEFCSCCSWAWADIHDDIRYIASGANMKGFKKKETIIAGCSDWFRPVIFEIQRIEEP